MNRQTLTPALKALARMGHGDLPVRPLHIWFEDQNYERVHVAWVAGNVWPREWWFADPSGELYAGADNLRLAYYLARIGALYLTDTQRCKLGGME